MSIPTEPIGSIPRALPLVEAPRGADGLEPALEPLFRAAVRGTIARFVATGSPVISDGEQRKNQNYRICCVQGLPNTDPEGLAEQAVISASGLSLIYPPDGIPDYPREQFQLGTTDDCGFSPFCDDTTTTRDLAFAKIEARVGGTELAAGAIGIA